MAATISSPRRRDYRGILVRESRKTHVGHELVAARMLILAGGREGIPLDYGELEHWTRIGIEQGTPFQRGER
jgi:hypothetical protein